MISASLTKEMYLTVSSREAEAVRIKFSTIHDAMAAVEALKALYLPRGYRVAGGYEITEMPGEQETVYVLIAPRDSAEGDVRLQIAPVVRRM